MKARPDAPPAPEGDLQDAPVESVPYVGPTVATVLRARGVATVGDLLAQLPRRYLDLRGADDWRRVRHAATGTLISVEGFIEDARWAGNPRARRLSLALREPRGTTVLRAVFFHARSGMSARLAPGMTVRLTGTLKQQPNGPELVQPKVLAPGTRTRAIEPIYAGIGSVPPGTVLRIVTAALAKVARWGDPVPPDVARALGLPSAPDALRLLHAPDASVPPATLLALAEGRSDAHRRLAFEELLAVSVALERARRSAGGARVFADDAGVADLAGQRLGLTLTGGQRGVIATLLDDLASGRPMRRLLVGDVGSGKTAVALAATLAVLRGGGSAAWLCPTTLVAAQHARTLERGLSGDAGPMAVLLGSTAARARRQAEKVIAEGLVRMVVGTHAILEAGGTPPSLDLVVIDEQHRFGVAQRLAMVAGRSPSPHLLVLSATPIPRTLALAQYGDLDLVTLAERPANRQPVTTRVAKAGDREFVQRTIQRALEAGGRVFVVVPRIDGAPDEEDGPRTGVADAEAWLGEALGRDRLVVLHGRMHADAQKEALDAFRRGTHPLLVGTTVVEVGLDVPEANLMVVLGAEFFGVAQLHQLRGRVGRGGQRAACLLVPEGDDEVANVRLGEVAGCADGFVLAERDLARRGAGEWFGERQSGADLTLRFADPVRDAALLAAAREAAARVVSADPTLAQHPALSRAVHRLLQRGASPVAEEAGSAVAAPWRRALDAAVPVALAAAALDGVMAFARDAEAARSVAPLPLLGASAAFVLLVGLALALALALWRRAPAAWRLPLATVASAAVGALAGLALFSGTGVRRLGLQRPLVALAVVSAAALGALAVRRGVRPRVPTAALAAGAVALYWAHATVLVRQYELLHALTAVAAAGLWCGAASAGRGEGLTGRGRWLRWGALAAALGSCVALGRGHRARSVVRRVAPLGQYVARAVGALVPAEIAAEPARNARPAGGPSLPLDAGDVVLVTVDALRADQLRALGGRGRMPHLDALAARGLLFRRAYAATPHTSYSLASLMTGTHARAAMALGARFGRGATLAGRLRQAGFETAGWYPPAVFSVDGDRFGALASRRWDLQHAREEWDDAPARVAAALQWARTVRSDRRAFAWVHLFEPHEPYALHPAHPYGAAARERYDAECSAVDDAIAALVRGWGRPATWIITADHGEEFGEHGGTFHGTSLYDEQSRVPLVIVAAGVAPRVVGSPVSLVDLLPTVLAGVGAAVPRGVEGADLGPLALADRPGAQAFAETGHLRMVVDGHDKLIVDTNDGTLERYDLARDPAERRNLADEAPARTRALRALVAHWEGAHAEAAAARSRSAERVIPPALARALQGDRAAAPEVVALLPLVDDETAVRAARALGALGDDSAPVRDGLAALLGRAPALSEEAAVSLVRLGDARGRELATRVLLGASEPVARRRAALGLARWRVPETVPVLNAWAVDERTPDAERDRVVALLQDIASPTSRPAWERLLESARLAPVAAAALGALGDPASIPALHETLARWQYPLTQRAVVDALVSLGDPEAIPRLGVALGVGDPLDRVTGLLARVQEPGGAVAGWRSPARRFRRSGRFALRARQWSPVQRIYVQLDAAEAGTVTVEGADPQAVHRGAQEIVVTLEAPRVVRSVAFRSTVPVSVGMIAAVALCPPPPAP